MLSPIISYKKQRLFALIFSLFFSFFIIQPNYSQKAKTKATKGRLVKLKVFSKALKANLLRDSAEQDVAVYLPPSYDSSKTKRFPTLYLLHGFNGKIEHWTNRGYQGMSLQPMMDELIKAGKIREMIVVIPNGTNALGGSFYTNSVATGNWEDFVYKDLVSYIDQNYRTLAHAESRGIAGHSMGGYASIMMGMKYPETFSVVYALSPCCLGIEGDMGMENTAWKKVFQTKTLEELRKKPESYDDFWKVVYIAMSASFSPNPNNAPFFGDYPYRESQKQLLPNEKAVTKWRKKMPLYLVDEYKQNLLKLRGISIDYGQNEEFSHIRKTSYLFSKKLAERGIPHTFEIYPNGNHGNKIRERMETKVLQFFSNRLRFSKNSK